jgi:hypothetical protein
MVIDKVSSLIGHHMEDMEWFSSILHSNVPPNRMRQGVSNFFTNHLISAQKVAWLGTCGDSRSWFETASLLSLNTNIEDIDWLISILYSHMPPSRIRFVLKILDRVPNFLTVEKQTFSQSQTKNGMARHRWGLKSLFDNVSPLIGYILVQHDLVLSHASKQNQICLIKAPATAALPKLHLPWHLFLQHLLIQLPHPPLHPSPPRAQRVQRALRNIEAALCVSVLQL